MKKKKGGWLTELVLCAIGFLAFEYVPGVADSALMIFIVVAIGWCVLKLFRGGSKGSSKGGGRARRGSAPTRMGKKAGAAFYDGAMSWMTPKQKSQYEKEIEARDEARKKYMWHEQQAKKFAGTSDGAWHEQRMKELWNKMR